MTTLSYDQIRLLLLDTPAAVGRLRQNAGLSLAAVARISGVPEMVISQLERSFRDEISSDRINALAKAMTAAPCPHCHGTGRIHEPDAGMDSEASTDTGDEASSPEPMISAPAGKVETEIEERIAPEVAPMEVVPSRMETHSVEQPVVHTSSPAAEVPVIRRGPPRPVASGAPSHSAVVASTRSPGGNVRERPFPRPAAANEEGAEAPRKRGRRKGSRNPQPSGQPPIPTPPTLVEAQARLEEALAEGRIGTLLIAIREASGENRRAFAIRAGVPAHALVDLERGKSRTTANSNSERIAAAWLSSPVPKEASVTRTRRTPRGAAPSPRRGSASVSPASRPSPPRTGSWNDDDDLLDTFAEEATPVRSTSPGGVPPRVSAALKAASSRASSVRGEDGLDPDELRVKALQEQILAQFTKAVAEGAIGTELRKLRRRLNLPQQLVARRANVDPKIVRDLESGARTQPGRLVLEALSKALAEELGPGGSISGRRGSSGG